MTTQKPGSQFEWLSLYLDNVAANQELGLDRALDTAVNMFRYELHDDYQKLRAEATAVLAANQVDQIVELARARKIVGLEVEQLRTYLQEMAGDDQRYDDSAE